MKKIVTKVLRDQQSGYVRGIGCGLIPTPLSSFQTHLFTQSDKHDECRKRHEDIQSEFQQTRIELREIKNTLQATVDFLMSHI
jgi:hypothetical protein